MQVATPELLVVTWQTLWPMTESTIGSPGIGAPVSVWVSIAENVTVNSLKLPGAVIVAVNVTDYPGTDGFCEPDTLVVVSAVFMV